MSRATGVFVAVLFVPALAFAQQPCTTDARRVVNDLYRNILERPADSGSDHWVNQLSQRRMSVREVAHHIAASAEHAQRFGHGDHRAAVMTLYRHLLGRQPNDSQLNHWTQILQTRGLNPMIEAFVNSDEYMGSLGDWGVPGARLRFCEPGTATSAPQLSTRERTNDSRMRFRGMDADNDGRITRSEWRGNARAFRNQDTNNDGVLSGDEVNPGAPPDDADMDDPVTSAESRFDYLDVNGNGRIDRDEWDGSEQAFDRIDRNRDGRLNRAEVGTSAPGSFASLDVNDDGRISLDEWRWSRRAFEMQDGNDDGFITRNEYRARAVPTTGRY
jgi:Ca2+-binding EF-hand superfamily protein